MIQFNTAAVFELAGGPAALRRALTEVVGHAPAEATVAMWKSRNRIAAEWLPACIVMVLRRHPEIRLEDALLIDIPDDPF